FAHGVLHEVCAADRRGEQRLALKGFRGRYLAGGYAGRPRSRLPRFNVAVIVVRKKREKAPGGADEPRCDPREKGTFPGALGGGCRIGYSVPRPGVHEAMES